MNRFLLVKITVVVSVLAIPGPRLFACGEKFLMNGRIGAYMQMMKAARPGTLLVYLAPGSDAAVAFKKEDVSFLLTIAGHKFRIETDRAGFDTALASGKYDLALTDSATVGQVVGAPAGTKLVPVLAGGSIKQRLTFEKQFGSAVRLPSGDRDVVDMLDKAMKVRAKALAKPS